jgi:hypothetical protein
MKALQDEMAAITQLTEHIGGWDAGVLAALIDEGSTVGSRLRKAEQATMAIGSVANFMYEGRPPRHATSTPAWLSCRRPLPTTSATGPVVPAALRSFRGTVGL